MRFLSSLLLGLALPFSHGAGVPKSFVNKVDHFSTSTDTFSQRYYVDDTHFKGPGNPIFCIMGGEGAIPNDVALFYPFVYETMASEFGALTIEPEHRYFGESLPFGNSSYAVENLKLLNTPQALADAADFIVGVQKERGCTARGTPGYCPVITVGGSYPGFLAAMMRLRYPAVVDIGYAASAPMRFYTQEVDQYEYYKIITASAERAIPTCPAAVRTALDALQALDTSSLVEQLNICPDSARAKIASDPSPSTLLEELLMVVMVQFANLNMGNYPPTPATGLYRTCESFVAHPTVEAVRQLLKDISPAGASCFTFESQQPQVPYGKTPSVACGDWSGCGAGSNGESWDYETCTFLVEAIGTNGVTDMFPARPWSLGWLKKHCEERYGVTPEPRYLADEWGFDKLAEMGASHIVFTNGLNDGWSAGGFHADLSKDLPVINMPNGAHHSDLSHNPPSDADTPDVTAGRAKVVSYIKQWLGELQQQKH